MSNLKRSEIGGGKAKGVGVAIIKGNSYKSIVRRFKFGPRGILRNEDDLTKVAQKKHR